MTETLPEDMLTKLGRDCCPDCGSESAFVPGPRGGMGQNIACVCCGAEFNIARFDDAVVIAHRNSPLGQPNRARLKAVFGIDLE
jgi:hypothetical protein